MKKAVLTYIFGKNAEILREPLVVEPDIRYVCVTDNRDLKSSVFDIIYEGSLQEKTSRNKMAFVKLHPWLYSDADKFLVMDGAMQIVLPVGKMMEECDRFLFKKHPDRTNISDEVAEWVRIRGMNPAFVENLRKLAGMNGVDIGTGPLVEGCAFAFPNTSESRIFLERAYFLLEYLGNKEKMFDSNQVAVSYMLKLEPGVRFSWFIPSDFSKRFYHNTWDEIDEMARMHK